MTVLFNGRQVDPISLWSNYVDFPTSLDEKSEFAPLVVCPNPDHHTNKRHFQINLTKPLVHCFAGCGISGSYEDAIAKIEGVTNRAARITILKHSRIGTGAPRPRKRGAVAPVFNGDIEYERFLPQSASEYLGSRGITDSAVARWELGWDADDLRIVIPAKDAKGRVRFLIKRAIKPNVEPRYLYPEGSERNRVLFGACFIDPRVVRSHGIVLVEGSIDTICFDQFHILPVGGILGSKVSKFQARFISSLRPKCVYTFFDADGAGIGATISAHERIKGVPIRVCRYPRGKSDPAELTEKEAQRAIERSMAFSRWHRVAGVTIPKSRRKELISVG